MAIRLGKYLPILGLACGTTDPGMTPPPPVTPDALEYKPCAHGTRVGGFTLERGEGFTAIEGRVQSAVVPANVREISATEGLCKLTEGRTLFCDPACGAGQTCGEGGVCIAFPVAQDIGKVTVTGLLAPVELSPSAVKHYSSAQITLPHPAWSADGALIGLSAGELSLTGAGVAELVVDQMEFPLERGQPLRLAWARSSTVAKIHVVIDLAHHGGIAASVECDAIEDTGSFEVPAALVSALLDIGVAGFPKITLTRRTIDSQTISHGCVELGVISRVDRAITIPGLVSCVSDEDCTAPATCQGDLSCR